MTCFPKPIVSEPQHTQLLLSKVLDRSVRKVVPRIAATIILLRIENTFKESIIMDSGF